MIKHLLSAVLLSGVLSGTILTSFTGDKNVTSVTEKAYLTSSKNYSNKSFIVKTKSELKISEATGKIMLESGIKSFDEITSKYKIKSIDKVFEINNGDAVLYHELGMNTVYEFVLDEKNNFDAATIVNEYASNEFSEYSELNYVGRAAGEKGRELNELSKVFVAPNDEYFYKQWHLSNDGSISPSGRVASKIGADINIVKAWELQPGNQEIIVAILDSGIMDEHPDLRKRIWINEGEIPNNDVDDDRNGYVDDYKGFNFAYKNNRPLDGFGHGTNIASTIGASTNNVIGFAGVDQNCRLMNCKNLSDDNYGEYIWWSKSIKYAVDNGAHIINMSEGGDDFSKTLKTAVDYAISKDVLIVAAMMNRGDDRDYYPASFKGVFAIGATDTDDNRCLRFSWGGGSCWGEHIGVVAPGNKIYGLDYEDYDNSDTYWSGTSQSTAIVSGLSSLLLAQDNTRTPDNLMNIIKYTAKDRVGDPREDKPGWDPYYGYGRIDSYLALSLNRNVSNDELDNKIYNQSEETLLNNDTRNSDIRTDRATPQKRDNGDDKKSESITPDPSD
jgi:subtilisin family serine protease